MRVWNTRRTFAPCDGCAARQVFSRSMAEAVNCRLQQHGFEPLAIGPSRSPQSGSRRPGRAAF